MTYCFNASSDSNAWSGYLSAPQKTSSATRYLSAPQKASSATGYLSAPQKASSATGYLSAPQKASSAAAWLDSAADGLEDGECSAAQPFEEPPAEEIVPQPPEDPDLALIRERSLPWLEERQVGDQIWEYCKICKNFATDDHLLSKGHLRKLDVQQTYDQQRQARAPPEEWGDPKFFQWREGWGWWCRLCQNWADEGHSEGKKHKQRLGYDEYYGGNYLQWYEDGDGAGDHSWENSALLVPDQEQKEQSSDPWGETHAQYAAATKFEDPWGPDWRADMAAKTSRSSERSTAWYSSQPERGTAWSSTQPEPASWQSSLQARQEFRAARSAEAKQPSWQEPRRAESRDVGKTAGRADVDGPAVSDSWTGRADPGYPARGLGPQRAASSSSGNAATYSPPQRSIHKQVGAASAWVGGGATFEAEEEENIEWC